MNTLQRAKRLVREIEHTTTRDWETRGELEKRIRHLTDRLHPLIDTAMEAGELINKGLTLLKEEGGRAELKRPVKVTKVPKIILDNGDFALLDGRGHKCSRCGTDEDMTDYYLTEWTIGGANASSIGGVVYCEGCVLTMLNKKSIKYEGC